MNKFIFSLALAIISFPAQVFAVCPLCTIAVAGGVGLARWLKIDDLISGLWIGGLILSLTLWLISFLKRKNLDFKGALFVYVILFYMLVYIPLYLTEVIGHEENQILGIDKLLVGGVLGGILFLLAVELDKKLREKNNNKVFFSYQKVIIPLGVLILSSLVIYLLKI
jgi:hypothetical protein